MSQNLNAAIAVIGIDSGVARIRSTSWGHDHRGAIVLRQKWSSLRSARV